MNLIILKSSLLILFVFYNAESNASGYGRGKVSLDAIRIAKAYDIHLEKRAVNAPPPPPKPQPPPPSPPPQTKPPSLTQTPTTVKVVAATTTTTKTTSKVVTTQCPFNQNLACSSSNKYQSFDGSCNNLLKPLYGSANTPYKRFLVPQYGDNANTPKSLSVSGASLPNPRFISNTLFKDDFQQERIWFHLFTTFGQFLTHDITSLAPVADSTGNQLSCPCGTTNTNCFNIPMPSGDTVMNQACIQFTRSSPSFQNVNCQNQTYREQLNSISSYLDCSQIYGSTLDVSNSLRTFTNGQLKTSAGLTSSRPYLPKSSVDQCSTSTSQTFRCFTAGENRTSENLGLVGVHTLFLRQHNRIATRLAALNPTWNDQTLFMETRRIVQGIYQHIIYNEWIRAVIGPGTNLLNPAPPGRYFRGYDNTVNGQLANEFAGAALRYGHTEVQDQYLRAYPNNTLYLSSSLKFSTINFQTEEAYNTAKNGLESIFLGVVNDQSSLTGLSVADSLRNNLFASPDFRAGLKIDLAATNINRGRDHGYPSYIKYREFCGLPSVTKFSDLNTTMHSKNIALLQSIYTNVNDIDLWVGGLAEGAVVVNGRLDNTFRAPGSVVGPTFNCLLSKQFIDLKLGDRFFYDNEPNVVNGTNNSAFTLNQLNAIKTQTISGLICLNYDVQSVRPNVFIQPPPTINNDPIACSNFADIDLTPWKI